MISEHPLTPFSQLVPVLRASPLCGITVMGPFKTNLLRSINSRLEIAINYEV